MARKYAIIIPDGCADDPRAELGGRTPLQAAETPNMDRLAAEGVVGLATFVPDELPPGSDVANLGLLGNNPREFYTGRAPLEAAAQGIELGPSDWAVRCNMVTVTDGVMRSFAAGHITTEEAAALLASLQDAVDDDTVRFVPSVGYRNLMICRGTEDRPVPFSKATHFAPPHDLADKPIGDHWPCGPGCDWLCELMDRSIDVFADHPVNKKRIEAGKLPATNVWLWGMGGRPALPSFKDSRGLAGAMITGVDLLRGIARLMGWDVIDVPGATGYFDTDYAAKGRAAIEALDDRDVVCVHVESPDEAGHDGNTSEKVKAIEAIDREIVGPIAEALRAYGDYRVLVTPDHPTPVALKTHTHGAVPWALCGTGVEPDASVRYDEPTGEASSAVFKNGWELMDFVLE